MDEQSSQTKIVSLPRHLSLADVEAQARKLFDYTLKDEECEKGKGLHVRKKGFRYLFSPPYAMQTYASVNFWGDVGIRSQHTTPTPLSKPHAPPHSLFCHHHRYYYN